MATVRQLRDQLTIQNPTNENADFLAQTPTTDVTREAQKAAAPLDQLAQLMRVPLPPANAEPPSPFNSYADAFQQASVVIQDSVAKVRRNPLRTDQDQPEFGLQIPA